jgi:hypothetical protein
LPESHSPRGAVVQGLWIGRPLSLIEQLSITSFLTNGHEFHLYCYEDVRGLPPGVEVKDANEILPASGIFSYQRGSGRGSVSAFSNIFRYKLLLERGGWWCDVDTVCVRPFDFGEPALFAGEAIRTGTQTASCVIKLPPGHVVAEMCYDVARAADRASLKWGEIGPKLLMRAVVRYGLLDLVMRPEVFCPIPYWHWDTLLAANPQPGLASLNGNTHALHLWHERWRRAGAVGSAVAPSPTSVFAGLLQRFALG